MASYFSEVGLNLNIYDPPWRGGTWIGGYTDYVKSYSHDLGAVGGFLGADIALSNQNSATLEDWIDNGLGREVKITTGGHATVFEGFINRIDISLAGYNISIGPFTDIANMLQLIYSLVDTSTGTAIVGLRGVSGWVSDASSIIKYGTRRKTLSTGGIQVALIPEILTLTLNKLKNPAKAEDLSIGDTNTSFDIRLTVAGWVSFFEGYTYNNTAATGLTNLSTKLKAIVNAEPNGIFRASGIQNNAVQVGAYENDDNVAWGLIKGLVALGDTSYNRTLFGVYEDRTVLFNAVNQVISYLRPLSENINTLLNVDYGIVQPWDVRPGKWVQVLDWLPGSRPDQFHPFDGPQMLFIESVRFTAPNQLTLNGSQSFKLDQRLAQLGISGLGI